MSTVKRHATERPMLSSATGAVRGQDSLFALESKAASLHVVEEG